jgi:hypothetical protein
VFGNTGELDLSACAAVTSSSRFQDEEAHICFFTVYKKSRVAFYQVSDISATRLSA